MTYEICEPEIIEAGDNILFPAIAISIIEFSNRFVLTEMRYISMFDNSFIAFINLRPHRPIFD
jgi:hypothetical protein